MRYNGDSDKQDLVNLAYDLTNTNVVTYPLQEMTRAANKTLRKVWSWIFSAYGGWLYDDANNTSDFPIAVTNLNASQGDYDLPVGSLDIRGVEILPQNGTVYQRLYPLNEEELIEKGISEASLYTSNGVPMYYRPMGSSIKIYPSSSYSITNGLRLTFDRGSMVYASTDTTKQAGFTSEFHEVVAVGMAIEYARRNALASYDFLQGDMNIYERNIKDYYSARYQEKYPSRINVNDETQQYI